MIQYKEISFVFSGKKIIDKFDCRISQGEHCALVGESGSGKSTLIGALMGLVLPESGSILIDGIAVNPSTIQQLRTYMAWVPQEVQLPYETVRETVMAPFSLKVNQGHKFDEKRFINLLSELGLEGQSILTKGMRQISGGEKQRLMIALAVLLNKKILLLDEPTSALDFYSKQKMTEFLRKLDMTMLSATHDGTFAESCDTIIRIEKLIV